MFASTTFAVAQTVKVTGINHSDFVENILPNMTRPAVILFGSNYCKYSREQLKTLRSTLEKMDEKRYQAHKYIDFYSVNVDTDEDSEWFESIYDADDNKRGTPTWVFYYPTVAGGYDYYYLAGNLSESGMITYITDLYYDFYFH